MEVGLVLRLVGGFGMYLCGVLDDVFRDLVWFLIKEFCLSEVVVLFLF